MTRKCFVFTACGTMLGASHEKGVSYHVSTEFSNISKIYSDFRCKKKYTPSPEAGGVLVSELESSNSHHLKGVSLTRDRSDPRS